MTLQVSLSLYSGSQSLVMSFSAVVFECNLAYICCEQESLSV